MTCSRTGRRGRPGCWLPDCFPRSNPKRTGLSKPAPPEQLLRREAMPTRHLGHHGARDQRLFENAGLVVRRPPPPATSTVDHLNTPWRPLRLKRKLKSRQKKIPNQRSSASPR